MRRVFVPPEQVGEDRIVVSGDDVKHMRDVLRMSEGSFVTATCGRGMDYHCEIDSVAEEEIVLRILEAVPDVAELSVKISLYQALPKGDKLELIIQKAVELGVAEIIPVRTARCVVRLDEAKAAKKLPRWQKIAEEAAKQSGRGLVPEVLPVMDFNSAVKRAAETGAEMSRPASPDLTDRSADKNPATPDSLPHILIPYELCEDFSTIDRLRDSILSDGETPCSIAVFIGSEGGFERSEVEQVLAAGGEEISLGHRILRTETAAIAVLAHLMLMIEGAANGSIS